VDELNAFLGWIRCDYGQDSLIAPSERSAISEFLLTIQNELFAIGSSLACAPQDTKSFPDPVTEKNISRIEMAIDRWEAVLKPLHNFILPGSGSYSAKFHIARTVTRRAERAVVALNRAETVASGVIPYLNRLSDAFFVLSRWISFKMGEEEIVWKKEMKQ
jgi:cob(I)alamin adenosyltransferase